MENKIKQSLNKGVPVETPIILLWKDLIELFEDKEKMEQYLDKEFEKYMKFLGTSILNERIELDFLKSLSLMVDPITLEKKIVLSKDALG